MMKRARSGAALLLVVLVAGCGSATSTGTAAGAATTASPATSLDRATADPSVSASPSVSSSPSQAPRHGGSPGGTAYVIPTFRPDSLPMLAAIEGTLDVGRQGCLVVREAVLIWPRGHTAHRLPDGEVEVRDKRGDVVARTGSRISGGGGYVEVPRALNCARGRGGLRGFQLDDIGPFQG